MPVDRDEKRKNMALREMVTMLGIEHAGIVTCHNVFYCKNVFHIAMEYMDAGSLLDAMRRTCHSGSYSMPLPALAHVCQKVLSALDFLHEGMQLVHRDVKPGNILLSMQGEVKLADLGICAQPMTEGGMHAEHTGVCATPVTEWIGTVTYMSPERLLGEAYGYSADMWSLGLVLIEAAVGRYPLTPAEFHGNLQFWDLLDIVMSDSTCALKLLEGLDKEYDELRTFTDACLIKNGLERPFAQDLLAHPLLNAADQSVFAQWVSQSLTESDRDFRDSQCLEVDVSSGQLLPNEFRGRKGRLRVDRDSGSQWQLSDGLLEVDENLPGGRGAGGARRCFTVTPVRSENRALRQHCRPAGRRATVQSRSPPQAAPQCRKTFISLAA
eukprot:768571-Hanusia_phi.AAC.8